MTKQQFLLFGGMLTVLGFMFVRVADLKANVKPLRQVIKEKEEVEDQIRFRATEPLIRAIHADFLAIRSDYPELAAYTNANLFLAMNRGSSWQRERKITYNSLLLSNNQPAAEGVRFEVSFCSRRGPKYYCGFGQNFGHHYVWQENKLTGLGISLTCSIDSNNLELLRAISHICDEKAGGTMEIVQQRNAINLGSSD